jgi:hypothetical protein
VLEFVHKHLSPLVAFTLQTRINFVWEINGPYSEKSTKVKVWSFLHLTINLLFRILTIMLLSAKTGSILRACEVARKEMGQK